MTSSKRGEKVREGRDGGGGVVGRSTTSKEDWDELDGEDGVMARTVEGAERAEEEDAEEVRKGWEEVVAARVGWWEVGTRLWSANRLGREGRREGRPRAAARSRRVKERE